MDTNQILAQMFQEQKKQGKAIVEVQSNLESLSKETNSLSRVVWKDQEASLLKRLAKVEELEGDVHTNAANVKSMDDRLHQLFVLVVITLIGTVGFVLVNFVLSQLKPGVKVMPSSMEQTEAKPVKETNQEYHLSPIIK